MQTPHTQNLYSQQNIISTFILVFITNLPFGEHEQKITRGSFLFLGWQIFFFYGQYSLYFMGHF